MTDRVVHVHGAGHKEAEHAHTTKGARVSRREGTPLFSPSRLRAAVIRIAPQFKVLPHLHAEGVSSFHTQGVEEGTSLCHRLTSWCCVVF